MPKSWSVVVLIVTFLISLSSLPDAFAGGGDAISESLKAKPAGIEMGDGVYRLTGKVLETKEKRLVLKTGKNGQTQSFHLAADTLIVPLTIGADDSITLDYRLSDGDNIVSAIILNESISGSVLGAAGGGITENGVWTSQRSGVLIAFLVVLSIVALFVLRKRRA